MPNDRPVLYSLEQAAAMREVIKRLRRKGLSSAKIAQDAHTSVRNIENFAAEDRERQRDPVYRVWSLYYNYAHDLLARGEHPELEALLKCATGQHGNIALSILADLVPDTEKKNIEDIDVSYSGNYLAYNFSYLSDYEHVSVTWVEIYYDQQRRGLRFEHRYRTRRGTVRNAVGCVVPTDRTFTLIGSIDETSNVLMAIMRRHAEPESHFDYLHGILLSVTRDRHPFACKIVMKKLPKDATIEEYDHKIKMTCVPQKRLINESDDEFDNRRALVASEIDSDIWGYIRNENAPAAAITLYPLMFYY